MKFKKREEDTRGGNKKRREKKRREEKRREEKRREEKRREVQCQLEELPQIL
jgi:hypothetical protein